LFSIIGLKKFLIFFCIIKYFLYLVSVIGTNIPPVAPTLMKEVTMLQLHVALIGLRFEAKTGMKMSGKVNTYRWVADVLGYPSKARPTKAELIANLEEFISRVELANTINRLEGEMNQQ